MDGRSQCGHDCTLLFYYVIQVPGAEEHTALPVTVGVDGVSGGTVVHIKRTLAGEPAFGGAEPAASLCPSVEVAAVVLGGLELLLHGAHEPQVLLTSLCAHQGGARGHFSQIAPDPALAAVSQIARLAPKTGLQACRKERQDAWSLGL